MEIKLSNQFPTLIWGDPGVGKTAWVESHARKNHPVETVIASISDPTDFLGVLYPTEKGLKRQMPRWFENLSTAKDGILFFDEFSCSPPSVQAALLRIVNEREIDGQKLPDSVKIVAAANPADIANGFELSAPMVNRFRHVKWKLDPQKWVEGMLSNWGNPMSGELRDARSQIAAYILENPSSLLVLPKEMASNQPFPSPRSWDNSSKAMAEFGSVDVLPELVGDQAALAFIHWQKARDLIDPELVLKQPEKILSVDKKNLYFVMTSIYSTILSNNTEARWVSALEICEQLAKTSAEVGTCFVYMFFKIGKKEYGVKTFLGKTKAYRSILSQLKLI